MCLLFFDASVRQLTFGMIPDGCGLLLRVWRQGSELITPYKYDD